MTSEDLIGIIELGNVKIKCVIFTIDNDDQAQILSSSTNFSEGIHNGVIINLSKASKAIRSCISDAEKKAEVTLKKINVVIDQPEFLCTKLSKDRKINGSKVHKEDIEFLLKEAKKQVTLNDDRQSIIHIFNHNYIVDGKTFFEEPIDVYADYLSHEMTFITMPKNNIKNINQAFIDCDIEIERYISCTFALAVELLNHKDLQNGAILIDLGFEKTSFALFKNLALINLMTLPIGTNHIAKDVSKVCSLTMEESNLIIKKFNFLFENNNDNFFDKDNYLKETYFTQSNYRKISKSLIINIIEARINEILEMIKKNILLANSKEIFGIKIFVTGVGSCFDNIDVYCNNFFGSEVLKINNKKITNESEESLSPCLGAFKLIKDGWETEAIPEKTGKYAQKKGFFAKIFS